MPGTIPEAKIGTDSIDREQVDNSGGSWSAWRDGGQRKKVKEFMDRNNSVVIASGREMDGGKRGYRGINFNEKNTIKIMQ